MNFNGGNGGVNNNNKTNAFTIRPFSRNLSLYHTLFFMLNMREYGFEDIVEDLLVAYDKASKNKRGKDKRLRFDLNFEEEIIDLANSILNRSYEIRPSTCFIVRKPVKREIIAADFRDRIIHHYIYDFLNSFLDKHLIYDCYSCREAKGTSFGVNRLEHHIRSCSDNYRKTCYVLQLDILGYFMHINRNILYEKVVDLLRKFYRSKDAENIPIEKFRIHIYLIRKVIFNDPLRNAIFKGNPKLRNGLPDSKTLMHSPPDCGLPIGNLTSQLFSNLYLNDFDQYVKRFFKIKHYGRYVDDFYFVDCCKRRLRDLIVPINNYLQEKMALSLHPNKIRITEIKKGISFLGIYQKPHRRYIKNKTLKHLLVNMNNLSQVYSDSLNDNVVRDKILSVINSYLGVLNSTKSFKIKKNRLMKNNIALRCGYGNAFLRKVVKYKK